ncbi:11502_t:CDS:2 [Funneliformis geosporum]|uniref:20029_t:CDS:1 n=1 Tax=Funneliformis geosporum TaxID=1117311 RepID=A0A9W4WXN8_9GLOM|nr:20029_t:CDS:2 [Funneliformis geosporum]CAI2172678.1 11502_t:CDS:2 [Funneliformis geosporum]
MRFAVGVSLEQQQLNPCNNNELSDIDNTNHNSSSQPENVTNTSDNEEDNESFNFDNHPFVVISQHSKKVHCIIDEENMPSIENEGICLTSENWITRRDETVTRIDQFIQRDRVILIRAPPFTGKTSLCILLEEYYRRKRVPVLQICFLGVEDMPFEEFWINETGKSWKYWLNPKHGERVIILDETHHIFDGAQYETFWLRIKSLCRQASLGRETIKVIAFSTGGRLATSAQSPVDFQQKFGFGLVHCTPSELKELVEAFNKYNSKKKIHVSEKIAQHIMEFTAGHLGLIRWILNGIDNYFSYRGTSYKITTDPEIMSYFTSSDFIEHVKAHRGAPLYKFNTAEGEVIDKLLLKDELRIHSTGPDEAVTALLKAGVLFYIDDKGPEFILREGRVGFVSPVARLLSFFHRCVSFKQPLQDGFTLQELVREALSRVNSKALTHNLGRSKDGMRLLERVWQMEFYRAIYSCLPDEMHISPDVGRIFATDGVVDFYISEPQWAIELLIDGIDMKRHHERFQDGGRYSSIPIKDYIILDIRETRTVIKSYPNTWHITPNTDFTSFSIIEGSTSFDVSVRKVINRSNMKISTQECEALEFEMKTLKRKRDDDDEFKEYKKRQNRKDVIESLEKLVDFLQKRERYLMERGAIEEAREAQRELDRASGELTKNLYESLGR